MRTVLTGLLVMMSGCGPDVGVVRKNNAEPEATIHSPADQLTFTQGDIIDFVGTVSDEDGPATISTVTWTSSLDFELAPAELVSPDADGFSRFRAVLSVGTHIVSLVVTDDVAAVGSDAITVTVISANQDPTASILSPDNFTDYLLGDTVSFVALANDEQDNAGELAIQWSAENVATGEVDVFDENTADTTGAITTSWTPAAIADYLVTLQVTDSDNHVATDERYLIIGDPNAVDLDGDGWPGNGGDCDDMDASTHPFAPELCGDSKDNDCNGVIDDKDVDRDGHIDELCVNYIGEIPADDCNDNNRDIFPGAPELPDGIDNTCEGDIDEGTVHYDNDGDCYCTTSPCTGSINGTCSLLNDGDCDDTDLHVFPGASEICNGIDDNCDTWIDDDDSSVDLSTGDTWYIDGDGDGYGDAASTACVQPANTVEYYGDCDDTDSAISPAATETCNTVDDDCDGTIDEDDASDASTWYLDADGDGYGLASFYTIACEVPSGYVDDDTDCDDLDPSVYPGTTEICNGYDDDCDSLIDDDDPGLDTTTAQTWYEDDDLDGFGDPLDTTLACVQPIDYVADNTDCEDQDGDIFPGATEWCNDTDDDCDGTTDEDDAADVTTYYLDADSDGSGGSTYSVARCEAPEGYVETSDDCDDLEPSVHPSATEICNGIDDDCDEDIDDDDLSLDTASTTTWYADTDSDGYGGTTSSTSACEAPSGYVDNDTDCDDDDNAISPAASEVCNTIDDDCDSLIDDADSDLDETTGTLYFGDTDGDGYGDAELATMACTLPSGYVSNPSDCDDSDGDVSPGGTEMCNSIDDDCDGVTDEDDAADATTSYADWDSDGYGDADVTRAACTPPAGYTSDSSDCDDTDGAIYPGADEVCNGVDDDCDGDVDDDDADLDTTTTSTWYLDDDSDGYGDSIYTTTACSAPARYVGNNTDCNDLKTSINPGAYERCNTFDDDCDGAIDESDAIDANVYYLDYDGDGYGKSSVSVTACTTPSGYTSDDTDCDDLLASVNPAASEVCNTIDDDCDGDIDDDDASLDLSSAPNWYVDGDGDGYGGSTISSTSCIGASGTVDVGGDCEDSIDTIHPGATEVCNSIDDDCDGDTDDDDDDLDATTGSLFHPDSDGDGYGSSTSGTFACLLPSGHVTDASDCDDSDTYVNPDATEICDDGIDNNCDNSANTCRLIDTYNMNDDADIYLDGSNVSDFAAQSVSSLGDWNGDGYDEILLGASQKDGTTTTDVGAVYVIGGNETGIVDLDSDAIAIWIGEDTDDFAGWGLDGGGDFDGDGTVDVLFGAPYAEDSASRSNNGMAYVVLGSVSGTNSVTTADTTFYGEGSNDYLGRDVAFAGDLDNDGTDELALAAPYYDTSSDTNAGRLYIISYSASMASTVDVDAAADAIFEGEDKNSKLGYGSFSNATDSAGDVDGDGIDDLLVGAFGYSPTSSTPNAGRAYLFYGDSITSGVASAGTADVIVTGTVSGEYLGYSVAGPGDVDGDGYDDIVIGADGRSSGMGAAVLFYGDSSLTASMNSTDSDATMTGDSTGERAGRSLSPAGDTDSDGLADFLVGAPYNSKLATDGGVAYLVLEPVTGSIPLGTDLQVGRFYGDSTSCWAGWAMSSAGDYDGDGNDDLLFGMWRYATSSGAQTGRAYIYLGVGL